MNRLFPALVLAATLGLPTPGEAQGGPGFLFKRPRVTIGVRAGYSVPRAESDIFDDAFRQFKLNDWDMSGPFLGGDVAARIGERWDVAVSAGRARSRARSEYRDWVDQDNLPIEQETTLEVTQLALGGRYYLSDRGRSIGRFTWVPHRLVPFVGAGVGYTWYEFVQQGDFVDFRTLAVLRDELTTAGGGGTAYAALGADLSIFKQAYLSGEARYSLAAGGVSDEFSAYDGIDLSGLLLTAGISLHW